MIKYNYFDDCRDYNRLNKKLQLIIFTLYSSVCSNREPDAKKAVLIAEHLSGTSTDRSFMCKTDNNKNTQNI